MSKFPTFPYSELCITCQFSYEGDIQAVFPYAVKLYAKSNPIRKGFEFVQYLEDNPSVTYDDLASEVGISKARVCQMIALCRRLPEEITGYLVELDEPEVLKHFTERKLRPLTLLTTDDEKIRTFHDMKRDFMTTLFQDSAGRGISAG